MSKAGTLLYCFSPPVMLATFAIEISFALYVLWRYRMTTITRLIVALLMFLAIFQGTEFLLCGGFGVDGGTWSRVGYAAITILPPLGIHLAHQLAKKKTGFLVGSAYASAAAFLVYFVFATGAISGHTCYANYAVFDTDSGASMLYGLYYYGWLLISAYLTWKWAPKLNKHRRKALYALLAGYLVLLIPTTTVNLLDQSTIAGIPSIMCGFAVILAFILVGKVAPESIKLKKSKRKTRFIKLPF